jgi:hypothetical protein
LIRPAGVLAAACGLALLGAGAASAAQVRVSVVKPHRGTTLIVFGTHFAPPNEFCTPLAMRIDGRPARGSGLVIDDYGTYAIRVKVPARLGQHTVQLRQTCENGNTGQQRGLIAGSTFRVIP